MFTEEDCIDALRKADSMVKGTLTHTEYREMDIAPSGRTLMNKFGSWNEAKKAAGLNTFQHGVNKSTPPASYRTDYEGYERIAVRSGDEEHIIGIHRLVAVAEYGVASVKGNVVHHTNNIPWDNRPENLEVMGHAEHARLHRQLEATSE